MVKNIGQNTVLLTAPYLWRKKKNLLTFVQNSVGISEESPRLSWVWNVFTTSVHINCYFVCGQDVMFGYVRAGLISTSASWWFSFGVSWRFRMSPETVVYLLTGRRRQEGANLSDILWNSPLLIFFFYQMRIGSNISRSHISVAPSDCLPYTNVLDIFPHGG